MQNLTMAGDYKNGALCVCDFIVHCQQTQYIKRLFSKTMCSFQEALWAKVSFL